MTSLSKKEILQYLEINETQFEELKDDKEKLKQLYRLLAKKKHPDAGGSNEDFANMQNAYEALRDGNYYEPQVNYECYDNSHNNSYHNTYDNSYTYSDDGYEYHGPAEEEEGFRRAYEEFQAKNNKQYKKQYKKEKFKKDLSWRVLWLLRGFVYGVLWIFAQLLDISTALVGLIGFGVIALSGLLIVFNWGEPHPFEILMIIASLVGLCLLGWFDEKKDNLLFEVWKWWQL